MFTVWQLGGTTMSAHLKLAVDRICELRSELEKGTSLAADEAAAALTLLQVTLEDDDESSAEELMCAMAVLCSRQANLFESLARIALAALVRLGMRHSHEVAKFAQGLLRHPPQRIVLDERASNWLRLDFLARAVSTQHILDELATSRG
ncbi:MAG: hypothetical protein JNM18_24000 [Planctomycetaceae bacterium]|nr:hypothetical protein [Planctomycetaceae bacterium]